MSIVSALPTKLPSAAKAAIVFTAPYVIRSAAAHQNSVRQTRGKGSSPRSLASGNNAPAALARKINDSRMATSRGDSRCQATAHSPSVETKAVPPPAQYRLGNAWVMPAIAAAQ